MIRSPLGALLVVLIVLVALWGGLAVHPALFLVLLLILLLFL